jgi:nitrite reductase/ring-hydroxylating ferredoxin subunit
MAEPSVPASSRRTLLACAGAACAAALAGCARYNSNNGGIAGGPPAQSSSPPATPAGPGSGTGSGPAASSGPPVARTSDIPVGGGKILIAKKIVITQPQAGSFHAFTAVCTHQGCIVGTVAGGTINCPCHGSKFSVVNGSVVNGPAASPLAPVSIKVQGTSIVEA